MSTVAQWLTRVGGTMDAFLVITNLERLMAQIDEWEKLPVRTRDSTKFKIWQTELEDWLRKGGDAIATETAYLMDMMFCERRPREPGTTTYSAADQQHYEEDLAIARVHIVSAIQTLRHDYAPQLTHQQRGGRADTSMYITQITNVSVMSVFETVREKIAALEDTPEKKTLLEKLNDVMTHPLFSTVAGTTLGSLMKSS
ncbi:MAG TPA: hypothetical protein VEP50_17475 [bacterium]|nr:hypothetical protein [bacterium]